MNIHFALRKQGKHNPTIVLNVFDSRFKDRKFSYSTGISIEPDHWKNDTAKDKAGKKVIKNSGKPNRKKPGMVELDNHLDALETSVKAFLNARLNSKSLSREDLRRHLESGKKDERKEQEEQFQKEDTFFKVWKEIIDTTKGKTGEPITSGTKRSKEQTLNLVTEFAVANKLKLTLEGIDMKFYQDFDLFMQGKGLGSNSRGKHFKEIKAVMREAHDRDLTVNLAYLKKSFKVIRKGTDSIYLSEGELKKMLKLNLTPAKAVLRDLFVMAAFVGARHGDWHQIRKQNIIIQNGLELLKITQQKTKDTIHIPIHPIVRTLLNKYETAPKVISNQKFNKALKEICKHEELKLGKVIVNGSEVEKWEEVSTHTARRSFATNAYLARMDVYQIMRCTGHKTESSFLKYLKLGGRDYAELAASSKFFTDDSWTMGVAV